MKFISEENYKNLIQDKQLGFLDNYIQGGNSVDEFKLFTHEVGRCKSVLTTFSMVEGYIHNKTKYLYVVKDNKLAQEALDRINEYCKERNQESIAIFLNAENKKELMDKIKEYPILIITHARYKMCCTDSSQRKLLSEDRKTLIIDEEIQIFETLLYNLNRYEWYFSLLSKINPALSLQYNKAMTGILNALYTYKGKKSYNCTKKEYKIYKKEIAKLRNMLEDLDGEEIKKREDLLNINGYKIIKTYILEECDTINNFYTHTVYFECGNLYTYDSRFDFWLLDGNNMLLDASGYFLYTYKLSELFNVKGLQSRVIDRSNWKINFCNINTTTSAKDKMVNFYDEVIAHIQSIVNDKDKILIAGKKNLDENYLQDVLEKENIDYGYYGNLVGHNIWRDFNKFYSIATFQMPSYCYVVKYLFYSKKKLDNRTNLKGTADGKGKNKVYRFFNNDLEKVRTTTIVSEIYQACGRIARVDGIDAEFYLIMNDETLKELIIKQFKNIQIGEFSLDIQIEKKDNGNYDNTNRIVNGKQGDFMRLILDIKKGIYTNEVVVDTENKTLTIKKKDVCEKINIDKTHLKRLVLDKPTVVNFLISNNITTKGQKIVIPY